MAATERYPIREETREMARELWISICPFMDVDPIEVLAEAIRAAEQRGAERGAECERDRLANMIDPGVGIPSDTILRRIHADVEMRGRKNAAFAITVHHRNIMLSATAAAVRGGEVGRRDREAGFGSVNAALVAALQNMVDADELTADDYDQAEAALAAARKGS